MDERAVLNQSLKAMREEKSQELEDRKVVQQYYQKSEGTKEFCETSYYNQTKSHISFMQVLLRTG